jgi:oligopeptide/dipeptide ABC transporter ATP-binding protein
MTMSVLLEVRDLRTQFAMPQGPVTVVDGVSFDLATGETLAVVGESGCGKSVTALSLLRILPEPQGRVVHGTVRLDGRDLLALREDEMRGVRGDEIAMIFQEPMTSLNPVRTIGDQIVEALRAHRPLSMREARAQAIELLTRVRIPDARRRLGDYPHRLSGGMRQRVMIAMALACRPKLLIADEPTTALDVTIQAQILSLLRRLQDELGMAIMLITHNLGVVAGMASRVIVMYAGRIVEEAPVEDLFARPLHPYTEGLLGATPRLDTGVRQQRLADIPGIVPPLDALPLGCAFAPRCPKVMNICRAERPALLAAGMGRRVACFAAQTEAAT